MDKQFLMGWIIEITTGGKICYASDSFNSRSEITDNITRAKTFKDFGSLIQTVNRFKEKNSFDSVKICKSYFGADYIDLKDEPYNYEIQKAAIKKLNSTDVEALSLESLATFVKLDEKKLTDIEDFYPNEDKL